jgi:hypothetical protein
VDFVDEEDIPWGEIGEDGSQISYSLDRGA